MCGFKKNARNIWKSYQILHLFFSIFDMKKYISWRLMYWIISNIEHVRFGKRDNKAPLTITTFLSYKYRFCIGEIMYIVDSRYLFTLCTHTFYMRKSFTYVYIFTCRQGKDLENSILYINKFIFVVLFFFLSLSVSLNVVQHRVTVT